jgi:hypothetical protein
MCQAVISESHKSQRNENSCPLCETDIPQYPRCGQFRKTGLCFDPARASSPMVREIGTDMCASLDTVGTAARTAKDLRGHQRQSPSLSVAAFRSFRRAPKSSAASSTKSIA